MGLGAVDEATSSITKADVIEWLNHPVTKAVALVLAAEIVYQLTVVHGSRLLGLLKDEDINA